MCWKNKIYYGDNLKWMQNVDEFPSNYVDLIYLDPPFNSNKAYNIIYENTGSKQAQTTAFNDTWTWDDQNKYKIYEQLIGKDEHKDKITYQRVKKYAPRIPEVIQSFRTILGTNNMMAYLIMMVPRLIEMKRILKSTGSIYLHCDPTASHYLKIVMDNIFGLKNFQNEIIWFYNTRTMHTNWFARKHDVILFYSKSNKWIFNKDSVRIDYKPESLVQYDQVDEMGRRYKRQTQGSGRTYLNEKGQPCPDVWDIQVIGSRSSERTGYPTQKPLALLERIIKASSNAGDVILDPFCGCATTMIASQKLNRNWIGIDLTYLSVGLLEERMKKLGDIFKRGEDYEVYGDPASEFAAKKLFKERGGHEFASWAISKIRGYPNMKKSGDEGIDGFYNFYDNNEKKTVAIQVTGGDFSLSKVRDFCQVINRDDFSGGIFISFKEPTKNMKKEASSKGYYQSSFGNEYKKFQFLTVKDIFEGKKPEFP